MAGRHGRGGNWISRTQSVVPPPHPGWGQARGTAQSPGMPSLQRMGPSLSLPHLPLVRPVMEPAGDDGKQVQSG